jgi:hypothetical protein
MPEEVPMKAVTTTGVFVSYDRDTRKLVVLERRATLEGDTEDRPLLEISSGSSQLSATYHAAGEVTSGHELARGGA